MATVNYTCPNCAAPLKFNPDKQMFSCEYCMSDFTEKYVQDFFAKKEQKENSAEKQEKKEQEKAKENAAKQAQSNDSAQAENKTEEEAVIYNCPSCGAQVVTTASTAATTCFYCQNPVVLGGKLSYIRFEQVQRIRLVLCQTFRKQKFSDVQPCNSRNIRLRFGVQAVCCGCGS